MKTQVQATQVTTDGIGETKKATIDNSAKIFGFFSKQIYSNQFVAIFRELVANGIDAQKVNGSTERPIVTLPSALDPIAKVRDFGTGMGHEFMMNKFMAFGDASTKEDSNDFIGGFGIGSKAPLAYTEQYSITNFQNGVQRIYSVFKDETGCPAIAFLSETKTDQRDGVEVSFPVRQDDISKFNNVVCDTLQYFDPLPRLENTQLELNPVQYDGRGEGWGINLERRTCQVIIGGVAYPLDLSKMTYTQRNQYSALYQYAEIGADIYLPIGEAQIALSREHITHDDDLFSKLDKTISGAKDTIGKQLSKAFEDAPTLWEAKKRLSEVVHKTSYYDQRAGLIRKHVQYRGEKLDAYVYRPDFKAYPVEAIFHGSFSYNEKRSLNSTEVVAPRFRAWDPTAKFLASSINRIIVVDEEATKPLLRVRTVVDTLSREKILFIRQQGEGPFDWAGFMNAMGNPDFELLSDYAPMRITRSSSSATAPTRPLKCYVGISKPYHGSFQYVTELPAGGGVYVQMDNFQLISEKNDDKNINVAKLLGKTMIWLNITNFKNSKVESNPDWISVDEAVKQVKSNYHAKNKRLNWAEAYYAWTDERQMQSFEYELKDWAKLSGFPKKGPLFQLNRLRLEFDNVNTSADSTMRRTILGVKYEDQLKKIEIMAAAARREHPYVFELEAALRYTSVSGEIYNKLF